VRWLAADEPKFEFNLARSPTVLYARNSSMLSFCVIIFPVQHSRTEMGWYGSGVSGYILNVVTIVAETTTAQSNHAYCAKLGPTLLRKMHFIVYESFSLSGVANIVNYYYEQLIESYELRTGMCPIRIGSQWTPTMAHTAAIFRETSIRYRRAIALRKRCIMYNQTFVHGTGCRLNSRA